MFLTAHKVCYVSRNPLLAVVHVVQATPNQNPQHAVAHVEQATLNPNPQHAVAHAAQATSNVQGECKSQRGLPNSPQPF